MNKEDVIRMAQEAKFATEEWGDGLHHVCVFNYQGSETEITEELERFAALVASHALVEPCCGNYDQCQKVCMPRAAFAEREACAKVCEDKSTLLAWPTYAQAIRARGQA